MTITGNLRIKQPFLGIEVAPNNDLRFWEEKENSQGDSSAKIRYQHLQNQPKTKKEVPIFFRIDTLISRHKQGGVMPVGVERAVLS